MFDFLGEAALLLTYLEILLNELNCKPSDYRGICQFGLDIIVVLSSSMTLTPQQNLLVD